jgi:excisionase family DNA binding protein
MRGKAPKPAPPSLETAALEPLEPLYTVADVAAHFRTALERVHRWIRSGKLGARRIGKLVRIAPADLADFALKPGRADGDL